jgi:hypothetical protein
VDDNITGKRGEAHYLSPSFLWHPPHYRSPSFLSILLTTSLPHSYPSSSLPLFLLPLSHPHYLSPSFLSVILTTSLEEKSIRRR